MVLLAAGCASPRASGSEGSEDGRPPPVALVAGERVSKAALSDVVYDRFREQWVAALDLLIDDRVALLEARRHGVGVPPAAVETALEAEVRARDEQSRRSGADLAGTVRSAYGMDLETWKRNVLRPRIAARLLLERVVRRSARAREQVVCRVIVVSEAARARTLMEALARGADFGLLALQESRDPSRASGGLLPAIARGDLAHREPVFRDLEDRLFAAAPGTLVGPVEVAPGRGRESVHASHIYKVVERRAPWPADPAATAPLLEADLVKNPVGRSEYERWAARARRDHGVSYFAPDGSPLRLPE